MVFVRTRRRMSCDVVMSIGPGLYDVNCKSNRVKHNSIDLNEYEVSNL
jgi:hypothetical protein